MTPITPKQNKSTLRSLRQTHKEIELTLRKRKHKFQQEVENWIGKYDVDMEERQGEVEDVFVIYNEEKAQLEELEQKYKELEVVYNGILETKRKEQEEEMV